MTLQSLRRADVAIRRRVTLASLFHDLAAIWGGRRLTTDAGTDLVLTYDDAADRVDRWAAGLSLRIDHGDRVVLAMRNGYDQLLAASAVSRAGGIAVPVNPQMRASEIDHVIADCDAAVVVRSVDDLATPIESVAPHLPAPDEVAALFYTSGTTGRPKGAALTHRSLVGQTTSAVLWPGHLRRDEVVVALPVAHIMGFVTLVGLALAGIPTFVMERFRSDGVLDAIESRRATGFVGVPAMYRMLLEAGAADRDLTSVRVWMSGADVMPAEIARAFKGFGASISLPLLGAVGEAAFVEGYGMVEVGGGVAAKISPPMLPLGIGDTMGFRLPGYRFRVVDDDDRPVPMGGLGELWVRGPGVLEGYWNAPDATAQAVTPDGWLRTGDLVRVGPLGTVVFCGRRKQVLKSGGYSVYPLEVEAAIEEHPEVAEAAIVGVPDDKLGEVPAAAVRLVAGSTLDPQELLAWAEERLAHYKAPRRIVVVDELPRTGTQKVQKDRLVELFT